MFDLPKTYLSYSSMDLWLRDKEAYRKRYYEGEPYLDTPYTQFGSKVGEALETGNYFDPILKDVPVYSDPEHELRVEIGGVPVLGYIDSFDPDTLAILEYKTGIRSKDGKPTWDRVKVRKHKQLPIYCLLVRKKFGDYNPDVKLVWMETKWSTVETKQTFCGKELTSTGPGLKLTGHIEEFDRHIEPWELDRMENIIKNIATEISEDYTIWKKTNKK